jgi:hypothetical protein
MLSTTPDDAAMNGDASTFRLAEFGALLGGRPLAATIRARITQEAAVHPVVVDLEGIQAMSPSFADELFAKIDASQWTSGQITIRHADAKLEPMVTVMIERRIAASE